MLGAAIIKDSRNGLTICCEDFDVDCFDGMDYEFTYTLDKINRDRLREALRAEKLRGSMKRMITNYFGVALEKRLFTRFCREHGIKYDLFTWIS